MPKQSRATRLVAGINKRYSKRVIDWCYAQLIHLTKEELIALFVELQEERDENANPLDGFFTTTALGCVYSVLQTIHHFTPDRKEPK